jgi:hypothetical protein
MMEVSVPDSPPAQQQKSGSNSPSSSTTVTFSVLQSPAWSIAVFNKTKIRQFFHTYHFQNLFASETSLWMSVVYLICDSQGAVQRVSPRKIRQAHRDMLQVRVVLLGPRDMFENTYAPRHFYFDFQKPSARSWTANQTQTLTLTQRLLNQKAAGWYGLGREQNAKIGAHSELPPPYIMHSRLSSPPGHDGESPRKQICQPSALPAESPEAAAERIAMSNLKRLGDANIPQTSATLFLDDQGAISHILYARPDPDQLGFIGDDEAHFSLVRVRMEHTNVYLEHPFEPLSKQQGAVVRLMQQVLQEACRNHIRAQHAVGIAMER